jgi:hypothetical protein
VCLPRQLSNCLLFVASYFDAYTAKGVASIEATEAIKTETVVSVDTLYSWPTHINGMYVCVLWILKGKFSKQMKKNILSYRIIRIKRIFPEFIDV